MLLTISLTHILPETIEKYENYCHLNEIEHAHSSLVPTIFVVGFIILLFFDNVICGHVHNHDDPLN